MSIGFAVVGVVEFVKRLFAKDYQASAIILGASIVGALIGHSLGITYLAGLIMGLQGSGFVTTASYLSSKVSTPVTTSTIL